MHFVDMFTVWFLKKLYSLSLRTGVKLNSNIDTILNRWLKPRDICYVVSILAGSGPIAFQNQSTSAHHSTVMVCKAILNHPLQCVTN